MSSHRWTSGFIAGAGCIALVSTGVAVASIPSSGSGSITGCVNRGSGAVRIVDSDAGKHCRAQERRVVWSAGYRYRGGWSRSATYRAFDIVTTQGSSYIAKKPSKGKSPASDSSVWGVLAVAGSKGDAGPGAVVANAESASSTTNFQDVAIPAMGLTMRAVCGAQSTSGVYLMDETASSSYEVTGSYELGTTGGGQGYVVRNGGPGPLLAQGLGVIHFTQLPDTVGTASEFVLDYSSGDDTMTANVSVSRGGHDALVHATLFQSASECLVQADATPASQ